MKKGIYRIITKLSDKTELPLTEFCKEFSATLSGRREVIFDGVISIIKYETDQVILEVCGDNALISGNCIEIKSFIKGSVCLSGRIDKIEFGEELCR